MMWKLWSDLQYHFYIVDILCMQPHNVCILQRKYNELDKIITNVFSFCGVGHPCNLHCLKQSDTSKYSKLTVFHFIFLLDKMQKKLDFVTQKHVLHIWNLQQKCRQGRRTAAVGASKQILQTWLFLSSSCWWSMLSCTSFALPFPSLSWVLAYMITHKQDHA